MVSFGTGDSGYPPGLIQAVYNEDFHDWRFANRKGGDFLVYSDVKVVPLNPPDTCTVSGTRVYADGDNPFTGKNDDWEHATELRIAKGLA